MIQFSNWAISNGCNTPVIARQYDNLSCSLTVVGDLPAGWDWSMLVESGGNLNIISLSPVDGGVGVTLTADMIPYAGYYRMQLRGTQGEAVRHTNIIQVYIPESLTGEGQWLHPAVLPQAAIRPIRTFQGTRRAALFYQLVSAI